ncbi:sialate O-acetylesterase [Sinomicrobium weinanense]|uniref:Sialate O-acetylesterase n=1 Tax=Sinomicrobium weinanense TaxID=2842200 RepID=A0A926Q4Q8_9FLAO|nr:sialate O-acetylesterase [Sinomicrobium weinanense]MBC9797155.1 sialate O-acetylesterase [Sinomicrobium weinanense]MBU3124496.1 sialate O-acetylesterase [Sinomicrobium weinanense]
MVCILYKIKVKPCKNSITLGFLMLLGVSLRAEVKLPAIFKDNMVLQQQTEAPVWGKASPGKEIKVTTSWDNKSYTTSTDKTGNWKLAVSTPVAGGPYSVTISDGVELELNNVLIGEVWICSGQSNMHFPMKGYYNQPMLGSNRAIATSYNPSIRLFTVDQKISLETLDDLGGQWTECTPEEVAKFSATAYFFGKMLQETLGVPVGLISTSWGGSPIESWMDEATLKTFEEVNLPKKEAKNFTHKSPTTLFNAMIHPLIGYGIRGAIWYQGEGNRHTPELYRKLMPEMVKSWRKAWDRGEFPFYYVQIAPYNYKENGISAFFREAQLRALSEITNSGMACLMDAGDKNCIHPPDKRKAGERLAYLALDKTYGKKGFASSGPVLKDVEVEGNRVKLTFSNASNGLTAFGKELENFQIAAKDKVFHPAKAIITKEGITVYSENVESPVAVRYAFQDYAMGDLFNTEGLPASSFRTDSWDINN